MPKTNFIPAAEYDHLCENCRSELSLLTYLFTEGLLTDIQSSDDEFPCNFMYDNKLFCGGYTCVSGEYDIPPDGYEVY